MIHFVKIFTLLVTMGFLSCASESKFNSRKIKNDAEVSKNEANNLPRVNDSEQPSIAEEELVGDVEVGEEPLGEAALIKNMADAGTVTYETDPNRNDSGMVLNTPETPLLALFYDGQPDKLFAIDLCVKGTAGWRIHSGGNTRPFGHMPGSNSGNPGAPNECNPLVIQNFPTEDGLASGFYNHNGGNDQIVFMTVIKVDANGAEIERVTNVPDVIQ